jgi:hypothetical protein
VDTAVQRKAATTGVAYKSKDEAVNAFRKNNADKYPTKFASEPVSRPSYVPKTTIVNGSTHTIIYDRGHGGYGYFIGPVWYPYSPMYDVAMVSMLMANSGPHYHYVSTPSGGSTTIVQEPLSVSGVIGIIAGIAIVSVLFIWLVRRNS